MKESLVQNKESSIENTQKSTRKIGVWWILCFISKEGFKNLCFSVPSYEPAGEKRPKNF